jgi:hypothetical protein
MRYNLQPCHTGGSSYTKGSSHFFSSDCRTHEWEVTRTLSDDDRHLGIPWCLAQEREHTALFRRISVERARAQVALDAELQRLLEEAVTLSGEEFDGNFLSGVRSIPVDLPEERTDG